MNRRKILLLFVIGLISISNKSYSQDTIKRILQFSARYTFYYNYRVAHHTPVFSIEYNNHNLYFGPEFSFIFQPTPIADIIYKPNSFGFNLGYRYFFNDQKKKLRFFSQFNFSIYQVKYKEYQLGPPISTERKKIIIENTGTLGADFNFYKNIHLFGGLGIGSTSGFFLMLNSFIPCSYIGLEYKF